MRASKFLTLSAAVLLAGGATQAFASSPQTSGSGSGSGAVESRDNIGGRHYRGEERGYRGEERGYRGEYRRGEGRGEGYVSSLTGEERMRLHEMVRDIPRVSYIGDTDIRIDGYVGRSVRQAAAPLPLEVQHMHPRFRHDRAFRYRDQVVILNPATSRIVAIVKTPA